MKKILYKTLFLFSIIIILLYSDFEETKKSRVLKRSDNFRTICRTIDQGKYVKCEFEYNDEVYLVSKSKQVISIGSDENYEILVDEKDLRNTYVDFSKPIVLEHSKFIETKPIRIIQTWYQRRKIKFEYLVEGKIYTRYQWLGEKKLSSKENYYVLYEKENHRKAYLFE